MTTWFCWQNPDETHNQCDDPEETHESEEELKRRQHERELAAAAAEAAREDEEEREAAEAFARGAADENEGEVEAVRGGGRPEESDEEEEQAAAAAAEEVGEPSAAGGAEAGGEDDAEATVAAALAAAAKARGGLVPFSEAAAAAGAVEDAPPATRWQDEVGYVPPGTPGFNAFCRRMMARAGVPSNSRVMPPAELEPARWAGGAEKPKLQPYQEATAWLCQPHLPIERLLVCHRVGSGKTATMIQICDNYFDDKRPKVLIFPTNAVCANFYNEICGGKFLTNRFASYVKLVHLKPASPEHRPEAAASELPVGRQMEGRDGKLVRGAPGRQRVEPRVDGRRGGGGAGRMLRSSAGGGAKGRRCSRMRRSCSSCRACFFGRVHPHYLRHPDMPSSPLRAHTHTHTAETRRAARRSTLSSSAPPATMGTTIRRRR